MQALQELACGARPADGGWGERDIWGPGRAWQTSGDPNPSKPQGPDSPETECCLRVNIILPSEAIQTKLIFPTQSPQPRKLSPLLLSNCRLAALLEEDTGSLEKPDEWSGIWLWHPEAGSGLGCVALQGLAHWAGGAWENVGFSTAAVPGVPLSHGSQNHRRFGYSGDEEVNPALLCDAKSIGWKKENGSVGLGPLSFSYHVCFPSAKKGRPLKCGSRTGFCSYQKL